MRQFFRNFISHVYWAFKVGEWDWGWEQYKGKPQFGIYHDYYDGHHVCFHLYKLWFGVFYF